MPLLEHTIMDRKLKLKVLKNGPNKDSQEEIDCAAWLIRNGLAEGSALPYNGRLGGHTANVIWRGTTDKGDRYLSASALTNIFLNPYVVTFICGLIIAAITVFMFQPWQDASLSETRIVTPENNNK